MRIVLLCLLLALPGCRKKTSAEFYRLESDQSILIARDGDDAYVSEEMTAIVTGLDAVSEDTIEKPRATALVTTLRAEQARVALERAPKEKGPPPPDPFAGRFQQPTAAPEPEAEVPGAVTTDAGALDLVAGMDEKTFVSLFGKCFAPGPAAKIADGGAATTQVVGSSEACVKKHGAPGAVTSYLFTREGYWGKSETRMVTLDAGVVFVPPPPPTTVREPVLLMPGAPLPEGYEKQPAP